MGTVNYTTAQINEACRVSIEPDYFGYNVNDDVGDVVVIGTADAYQTFIPDPSHITSFNTDEFTYNPTTGEITYTGGGELYKLLGSVSIDFSVVNTIVHFAIAVNGTIVFENQSKLESTTAIQCISLGAMFNLSTNDVITVEVKADKTGTLDAYHTQGLINEVKPTQG